jgi:hypothetical protein
LAALRRPSAGIDSVLPTFSRQRSAAMEIGDIVIYGGKRLRVRGFDPAGVEPRFVYLEDVESGETISVAFVELEPPAATPSTARVFRLIDGKELRPSSSG